LVSAEIMVSVEIILNWFSAEIMVSPERLFIAESFVSVEIIFSLDFLAEIMLLSEWLVSAEITVSLDFHLKDWL